jgi:uncharacterized membrane protein (UPF0127 family)
MHPLHFTKMIRNKTLKRVIAKNEKICSSIISKMIGLMFSPKKRSLVFVFNKEQKVPLHMMFVFFSIDVLFLDSSKKVVELKREFKPFRFYNPSKKAKYVIELPSGMDDITKIGDMLDF